MQTYNKIGLRESLEQLATEKLDKILQAELEKSIPDVDAVKLIVSILEERDAEVHTPPTDKEQAAIVQYYERMKGFQRKPAPVRRWMAVAASIALILGLLFVAVPQQAEAESFWEMLQRWSKSFLEIVNPKEHFSSMEYNFETDNPGLQQIYDAVVELGVTEPMVPMWLPDGCELTLLDMVNTPMSEGLGAWFSYGDGEIVYKLDVYTGKPAREFFRDDSHYESYEKNGTSYYITRNNNRWGVVWIRENIECSIILDCQEDTLRRILRSIYVMEDG